MFALCLIARSMASAACLITMLQVGEAPRGTTTRREPIAIAGDDGQEVIQVLPVKHANAHEILRVFQPLGLSVSVAVDTTSNSLVVRGPSAAVTAAAELAASLDRPSEAPSAGDPVFIQVKHRDVDDVFQLIHQNYDIGKTRVGADPVNHLLMVTGNQTDAARIRAFVERIDTPKAPLRLTFFFIRGEIVNEGNAADAAGSGAALPPKLAPVAAVLAETGFANMELSAPLTTNTTEDNDFSAGGRLAGGSNGGALEFLVEGTVRPSPQPGHARIEVRGEVHFLPTGEAPASTLFRVETTLITRLGDYVVVAAAPSSMTSGEALALVVRADSAEPATGVAR